MCVRTRAHNVRTRFALSCRNKEVPSFLWKHLGQSKERQDRRFPWQRHINSPSTAYCMCVHGGLLLTSAALPEQRRNILRPILPWPTPHDAAASWTLHSQVVVFYFLKSEQLILTRLFHLLLGPRNPEIQLQDTLLCLPSESVRAALNEKPQSFLESSVCGDKPSDAWPLRRTVKHQSVQSEVLSPNLPPRHRPNRCDSAFFVESQTYNFKVIWTLLVINLGPFLPCPRSHVSLTHFPPSNPAGSPSNMRHYGDIQEPGQNCPVSNPSPQMQQLRNLVDINSTFWIFLLHLTSSERF